MGRLILVTVPIGNLDDMTTRARSALSEATIILAEDTRVTRSLLELIGVPLDSKRILSFNDHGHADDFIRLLDAHDVVLVSDAGSPAISDPAYPLIRLAHDRGIPIETRPGVSSPIAALELSGLPAHPFHFHGFIPREKNKRDDLWDTVACEAGTHIFFEGISRVIDSVDELATRFPDQSLCIAREITKKFETVQRFFGRDWPSLRSTFVEKGECVLLIYMPKTSARILAGRELLELTALAQDIVDGGVSTKRLSKLLALVLNQSPKQIYDRLGDKNT